MADALPSIVVTGISGNLGQRLLPMLAGFHVVGVDFRPPPGNSSVQFVKMDLGEEASCQQLLQLLRDVRPTAVVHLAFVIGRGAHGSARPPAHVAGQRGGHGAGHGSHRGGQSRMADG